MYALDNLPLASVANFYAKLRKEAVETAKDLESPLPSSGLTKKEQGELDAQLIEFSNQHDLKGSAEQFFSNMLLKFSEIPTFALANGKLSGVALFRAIRSSPQLSGLLVIATHSQRGTFIKGQTDVKHRNYCALVPLVLSAFKKHHNVPYSSWESSELANLVEPKLLEAMQLKELPDVTKEETLEIREIALTPKTGAKMGIMAPPSTTYRIWPPKGSAIGKLPDLAQHMMLQTWCAHPQNRTNMMILNPVDWDDMPEELVGSRVIRSFKASDLHQPETSGDVTDSPW